MRVGIDLGGSHIGVGLINEDKILDTRQKNFIDIDRKNIRETIIENSIEMINELLKSKGISKENIELVGIASPRIN